MQKEASTAPTEASSSGNGRDLQLVNRRIDALRSSGKLKQMLERVHISEEGLFTERPHS